MLAEAKPESHAVTTAADQAPERIRISQVRRSEQQGHSDGEYPSALINDTQTLYPEDATASQSVGFKTQSLTTTQRKRASEEGTKESMLKRVKSSNMAQPIDVGEEEEED